MHAISIEPPVLVQNYLYCNKTHQKLCSGLAICYCYPTRHLQMITIKRFFRLKQNTIFSLAYIALNIPLRHLHQVTSIVSSYGNK